MSDSEILKKIIESLINKGVIKSLNDLAEKLPHDYGYLNRIKNNVKGHNLTAGIRDKLGQPPFNIDREFMLHGAGNVFKRDGNASLAEQAQSKHDWVTIYLFNLIVFSHLKIFYFQNFTT